MAMGAQPLVDHPVVSREKRRYEMERLAPLCRANRSLAAVGAVAITAASAATGMQHTALGSPLVGAYSTYAGALGGPYSLVLNQTGSTA